MTKIPVLNPISRLAMLHLSWFHELNLYSSHPAIDA